MLVIPRFAMAMCAAKEPANAEKSDLLELSQQALDADPHARRANATASRMF
jgi:hypothetical protein